MAKLGFIKATKQEMANVKWPSRARTITYTVIIIVFSLALAYFFSGVDSLLQSGLRAII
jgi:preprotein translocase SecE subunit